nr:PREDICTED: group 3 secretory phospholipase A2 [Apteryx mantelli mantelli]
MQLATFTMRFRRCLLDLNDTISNIIGITFFNLLEVPCFVLEQREECVQWHWWGGFRRCLLDLNDTISNIIGITFFNLLEVPCFVLEQREECVQWHWWGGCERYGVVPLARMVQQNQYYYGLPMEEPGNPTMRSPRKGRRKSSRLGRKRLRQRLGQNPKLRQTQSPGQNQRLVTVQQPWGPGTLPPASTREEAEPTTRYLTAPWQLEPGPSTAMAMLEQDSAGGRQILGAAQQGGGGSAHPACMAHHEEDSIRSSPAAELHRATPVPPLDQRRQQGRMCRCYKRLDKCEHQIAPHEVKYELHNIDTRTLFHCNCTRRLARFLRRVRGLNDVEEAVLAERIAMDCFILEPLADCGLGKEPQDNCITVTQAVLVPAWHLRNTLRHWGPLHVTSKVKHQDQKIQDSGGTLYERCLQLSLEQKWGVQHHMAPR